MSGFLGAALVVALLLLAGCFLALCVLVSLLRDLLNDSDPAADLGPASDPDLDRMTGAPW